MKEPRTFFSDLGKIILKFIRKYEKPQMAKAVLDNRKQSYKHLNARPQEVLLCNYTNKICMGTKIYKKINGTE